MKVRRVLLASSVFFASIFFAAASPIGLIPANAAWRYLSDGTDPGATWNTLGFDDSAWPVGPAQLGYGEGDEATVVNTPLQRPVTVYFRRGVLIPSGTDLILRLLRDDGAVVYFNGVEVRRDNMPAGPINSQTLATTAVGGADETTFFETVIPASAVVPGTNIIAVEVHQNTVTSSDLSFALELIANFESPIPIVGVTALDSEAREIPPWLDIPEDPAVFQVRRIGGDTNIPLTVLMHVSGTASNGIDYESISNIVTFPAGSLAANVAVHAIDDSLAEGTETVVLNIIPPPPIFGPGMYLPGTNSTATAFILDNDQTNSPPTVSIHRPLDGATFRAPTNILLIALARDAEDGYDIAVEFFAGTNKIGNAVFIPSLCPAVECPSWYLEWPNVPPGNYILTAKATDKSGLMTVSAPVHISVLSATNPPPERTLINVVATGSQTREPGLTTDPIIAPGTFTFYRTGNLGTEITVFFSVGGSASNGVDYVRVTNQVVIPANATQAVVNVFPRFDNVAEGTETVVLTLENPACFAIFPPLPQCYLVGPLNQATVFIADASTPTNLPPTVSITSPTDGAAFDAPANISIIAFASDNDSGVASIEFFEGTNSLGSGIPIPTLCPPDVIHCPVGAMLTWSNVPPGNYVLTAKATDKTGLMTVSMPVNISVSFSNAHERTIVQVFPADSQAAEPSGGVIDRGQFAIHRSGNLNFSIPVTFALGGSAANGLDYAFISNRVVIPAGSTQVFVTVTPLADNVVEGTDLVLLTLEPPVCPAIFPPPPECYEVGNSNSAVVFIADGPGGGTNFPVVRVFATDNNATEGAPTPGTALDTGRFMFTRTGGSLTNPLPVYFVFSGTASNTVDYFATNRVVIPPGASNAFLIIAPLDDFAVEPTETVVVRILPPPTSPDSRPYQVGSPSTATVFIHDNDTPTEPVPLIAAGSVWKYLDNGTDQGTAWRAPAFDDSSWVSGPAQLGYGDGDEATVVSGGPDSQIKYITTYFRRSFDVSNPASFSELTVRLLRDDGGVVYLNGVEVFRSNMPTGAVNYLTLALAAAGGEDETSNFYSASVDPSLLINGGNVVAVEIHQVNPASTDISFDLELIGRSGPQPPERTLISVVATDSQASEPVLLLPAINPGQFAIRRTGNLDVSIPVSFVLSGTASNGSDYAFISNHVVIPAGSTQALVNVVPLIDNAPEGTETVVLRLFSPICVAIAPPPPECYLVGAPSTATVFIQDHTGSTNNPPTVVLHSPAEGTMFTTPANILLRAAARDVEDGNGVQVEFFAGTNRIGQGNFVVAFCPDFFCPTYDFMWSNVPPGHYTLTARATDSAGAVTVSAPVNITVQGPPPGDRELHVVGIYSGLYNGGSSPNHQRGDASVVVNRPGKSVTLFLSAYEPVLWNVTIGPNTTLERVFLAGYYQQDIVGLPPGTPLTTSQDYIGFDLNCASFYLSVPDIRHATGQEMSSFQGSYVAVNPFVIDGVQDDPRLRSDFPQPVPAGAVPSLSFRLAFNQRGQANVFFRDYTLQGPASGTELIPGMRVFGEPSDRFYYGAENHEVWQIDRQLGTASQMPLPPGLPEFSWAWSGAYDTARNRFLVSSFGGEGFLYNYSSTSGEWTAASLDNVDVSSIVYHAATDQLFALSMIFSECDRPMLHRMTLSGEVVDTTPLPIIPFSRYFTRTELVSVGEYLVLLAEADNGYQSPTDQRIYLIDPRTGEVWLTYRSARVLDSDRDGVPDHRDLCSHTPSNTPVDSNGCPASPPDSDADGVPNDRDQCPNTPPNTPVDQNGCPLSQLDNDGDGVPNDRDRCSNTPAGAVVNEHGCGIAQIAPCDGPWRNHREYVHAVSNAVSAFYKAGLITRWERLEIVYRAVKSDCGRRWPRLTLPLQRPDDIRTNGCRLILEGDGPATCVIEWSANLIHWTPLSTNTLSGVAIEIHDPGACTAARRFYRMRWE